MAFDGGLTLGPFADGDAGFAAAAITRAAPHHPVRADELLLIRRNLEVRGPVRWFLLEQDDRPAGWVSLAMDRDAPDGRGRVFVILPSPDGQRLEAAWILGERAAREMGIRIAQTWLWEDETAALEALRRCGWRPERRARFWRLDLGAGRDRLLALRAAASDALDRNGYRVVTAADLGGEAVYPVLHEIHEVTHARIPTTLPASPQPYEAWLAWMRPPRAQPDRVWIALSGERPVGFSYLDFGGSIVCTGYTGVLPDHGGRGVARALKLQTAAQAIELGVEAIETENDSENAAILHLNQDLGYREIVSQLELHKRLADG